MKRAHLNFVVDLSAFIGFVILTTTGILMRYILPPGSGRHSLIWRLDRHQWGDIHFWISMVFFSILTFHLLLHWRWIVTTVTGHPREGSGFRAGLGIVGLFAVIALALSPLFAPVEIDSTDKKSTPSSLLRNSLPVSSINGSMTLTELEKATAVPSGYIIHALKLPVSISREKTLGSLKRKHGFEIKDVKRLVMEFDPNVSPPSRN